jgi:predicted nucleotidyltransferase component of viral defense system
MIDKNEIDHMAEQLDVHPSHVQRDYVHGWFLNQLYSCSPLSKNLTLKGGNALRKGYFEHSRYSRDIDFTTSNGINEDEIGRELNELCKSLTEICGVIFDTSKTRVEKKKRANADKQISEARLYFKDFYGKENEIVLAIRLDITQFDKIYLPVQERHLIHPYSDSDLCSASIKCVKLEEILATKMRCLLQRKHIADLFDLVYVSIIAPEIDIDRSELISTFFKITIFERSPSVAKGLFIDLPLESISKFWSKYIVCPAAYFFDFEKAKQNFLNLINELIPGQASHDRSPIFFPSSLRNPILEAADSMTMLKLLYSGVERLVEPYELVFKIKKNGQAREYFYAYDTVGGRSSKPGLKTFVSDGVQFLENTDIRFEPRFPVEISKSGGAETVSKFKSKSGLQIKKPRRSQKTKSIRTTWNKNRTSWGKNPFQVKYKVECPFCGKKFTRTTMNTKLNPHKDKFGNPCHGRTGYLSY